MKRPFCVIGGCFLGMAYLVSLCSVRIQAGCLAACILLFFLALCFGKGALRQTVCLGCCAAALAAALFLPATLAEEPVRRLAGTEQTVSMEIRQASRRENGRYTYHAQVEADPEAGIPAFQTILYTNRPLGAEAYDRVTLKARFYSPDSTRYFDSERYYRAGRVFLLAYFDGEGPVRVEQAERLPPWDIFQETNRLLSARAEEAMPQETAAVFQSMLLGGREELPAGLEQRYTDAGVVHLLAISGMHVSLLAGFAAGLFRLLRLRGRIPALVQMGLVAGFLLLSGCPLSGLRAGGMILLMLAGKLVRRRGESVNSLCCAGFFIVLCDIYAIMDVGFQMSFLATLGILTCAGPMRQWLCTRLRIVSRFWTAVAGTLCVTAAANLFLLPVYLDSFGTMSVVGPVANLLTAVPSLLVILVGFLLLGLWLLPVPALATALLARMESGLILIQNGIAEWLGGLPFASIGLDYELLRFWLLVSLLAVGAALLLRKRAALLKPVALFCTALFFLCHALTMLSYRDVVRLAVISDGETSNVVLIDRFEAVVLAAGDDDYIDKATGSYLKEQGVQRIDTLFLLSPEFSEYRDTLELLGMLPVETVLYHRENIACGQLLGPLRDNVYPMQPRTVWESEGGLSIALRDGRDGMTAQITCGEIRILLGGSGETMMEEPADLFLIQGAGGDLTGLSGGEIILLDRQYGSVTAEQLPLTAQEAPLEYEIVSGETLRRME